MNNQRISEAVTFASKAHDGQYRKGTDIPYISHTLEAALIAVTLSDDEDTVIAAILHDIVEDTPHTIDEIEELFGPKVSSLVSFESEDKMRDLPESVSWKERKVMAINHLKDAPLEAKIICLSDKLSNMRLTKKTFLEKGDDMWLVFNQKDKKEQEWYYRSIYEVLSDLKDTAQWKEYKELCDFVFR